MRRVVSIQSARMETLVVVLSSAPSAGGAIEFVRCDAGGAVLEHGHQPVALLGRAHKLIAVLPAERATLLALRLPPMPAARLQAALGGALEERLLDDPDTLHLAAGPRDADGALLLACACAREPLARELQALHAAGRDPSTVVPEVALLAPGEALLQRHGTGVRLVWRDESGEGAWLHIMDDSGAAPPDLPALPQRVLAEPGTGDLAKTWWNGRVEIENAAAGTLLARAIQSAWDLRQFTLAPQAAMRRGLTGAARGLSTPAWRRVGWLAALLAVLQLAGAGAEALVLQARQARLAAEVRAVVAQALPGVPAILDARLQMQRALDDARRRAAVPSSHALEALLGIATLVLPAQAPIDAIDYDGTTLKLAVPAAAASAAAQACERRHLPCSVTGTTLHVEGGA